MKKLSIAYLDFDDIKNPLLAAGQATATFEVASRLVKKGHQVTVFSSRYPGYKDRLDEGICYKHIGIGTKNVKLNNLIYILTIPFYVTRIKADIIIECFTAPISTLMSPLFTKIPVIGLPSMFNAKEFSKKYHFPFHLIEHFGAKVYKYFAPYSDIDSGKMKKLNPNIIYKIIPQGINPAYLSLKRKKAKYILFLGRFDISQKGIDLLLQAYSAVASNIGYPLAIAGHGPDEEKIKKIATDLKLENNILFLGPLYGAKKLDIMSQSLFVTFSSRHDELSLWALEALGAGLPLVCFDLPEYKWMGNKAVLRAKPFDTKEYGDLLLETKSPIINKRMSRAARQLGMQYTWNHVVNEFENFFYQILGKEKNEKI